MFHVSSHSKLHSKKERDGIMVRNNYRVPNKVTLARWVDRALDQALSKNNIRSRFKVTWIWQLNPMAMDENQPCRNIHNTTYKHGGNRIFQFKFIRKGKSGMC
jgi:hypothetical protein